MTDGAGVCVLPFFGEFFAINIDKCEPLQQSAHRTRNSLQWIARLITYLPIYLPGLAVYVDYVHAD
jgi:hypothetical protein